MKKLMIIIVIIKLSAAVLSPAVKSDGERFFLITGAGCASSQPAGPMAEAGVEARLSGNLYARLLVGQYFGDDILKGNETMLRMTAVTLFGLYRFRLSETMDFRLKLGGSYNSARSELNALGITFTSTKANIGFAGGVGFSLQLNNTMYIYAESTFRHVLFEEPWTWVEIQGGLMFRLR